MAPQYPDFEIKHAYADACTMWLMRRPRDFNVLVMGNLFGDVISDEVSVLAGSLGMFGLNQEAKCIEEAEEKTLRTHRTYDVREEAKTKVETREMGRFDSRGDSSSIRRLVFLYYTIRTNR